MRLWLLHPRYLDAQGLVALWREGLLAQAVLRGRTRGYTKHPQLARFQVDDAPVACLAAYLRGVVTEATRRGYVFDTRKISHARWTGTMDVARGQLDYEWSHLRRKLTARSRPWLRGLGDVDRPEAHPIFRVVGGGVAEWEKHVAAPPNSAHTGIQTNTTWHKAHPMPKHATLAQRVRWHVAHARACGCRAMPKTVVAELRRKAQRQR